MSWIQHPVILEGSKVRLVPLERAHFAALQQIATQQQIWQYMSVNCGDPVYFRQYLEAAVLKRATGEQYAFTVIDKATGSIIGSTMFHSMYPNWRKLEIGYTWYDPAYWRTGANRECKLLLLTYCFEVLQTIRVQLLTDENNLRSRAAIEGIGGSLEGILRQERVRHTGTYRNSAIYSIIDAEWPEVKQMLEQSLRRERV